MNKIIQTAAESGAEIYFVGGCVRDILLERKVKDVDMVPFAADYEKLAFRLANRLKAAAIKFKDNVRIAKNGVEFDVSAPRGADIHEDLSKRDFTINNLALSSDGELIGSDADIKAGLIRMVHEQVFDDDPLRVLRMYRFASQLGFDIDHETAELAAVKAPLLKSVAAERIFAEMQKLAEGGYYKGALKRLVDEGILRIFAETSQEEEKLLLDALGAMSADDMLIKISAFIYGFRKKPLKVMDGQCYPAKIAKRAAGAASAYAELSALPDRSVDNLVKYIYNNKEEWRTAADMFVAVRSEISLMDKLNSAYELMRFDKENIVDGKSLSLMGVPAGRLMGEIIRDVSFLLVSGSLADREDAEKYIKNTYGDRIDEASKVQNRKG